MSTSPVAKVTLGANRTLGAGSNAVAGQFVSILVIQDGTGSRTLSFNAVYEFTADTAPTLTTSGTDVLVFITCDGGTIWYGFTAGLALA